MDDITSEFTNYLNDDSEKGNIFDDQEILNEMFGSEPMQPDNEDETEERQIKMVNIVTDDDVTKVKKPKRVMLKLDLDKLFSDRGLSAIPAHVNALKFKGKGHELEDITKICKAYEHWAHRLYPKMRFKDVLEKVEHLGLKNRKKVFNKKMELYEESRRLKLVTGGEVDDEDDYDEAFDQCIMEAQEDKDKPPPSSDTVMSSSEPQPLDTVMSSPAPSAPTPVSEAQSLTEAQIERMRQNRLKALERKKQRESGIGSSNTLEISPLARAESRSFIPAEHTSEQASDTENQAPSKRFKTGQDNG